MGTVGDVDLQAALVLYGLKVVRVMVLWIALFVVEKTYQDSYVQAVLVEDGSGGGGGGANKPPDLSMVVVYAVAVEGSVMLLVLLVLALLKAKFKTPGNTFVIDDRLLVAAGVDYVLSTGAVVAIGAALGAAAQNGRLFRYRHDGLRAIRALCNLLLYVSAVVLVVPFYRVL